MTVGKQIKALILDLLSDGEEHSMTEIHNYVLSNNIILDKTSTLVRNIMHNLKKENPKLTNPSRGVYQLLIDEDTSSEQYDELNKAVATIEKTLHEYKRFNWYSCPDEELEIARTKVKSLLQLANTIILELK